jgi:hypothetical protein
MRTHDIGALIGLVPATNPLRGTLQRLEKLTPYAVAYRYPAEDDWELPTRTEIGDWQAKIVEAVAAVRMHFKIRP